MGFRLLPSLCLSLLGHGDHGSGSRQRSSVHFWDQTGNWKPLKRCQCGSFYLSTHAETFKDLNISNHVHHACISIKSLPWKHGVHLNLPHGSLGIGLNFNLKITVIFNAFPPKRWWHDFMYNTSDRLSFEKCDYFLPFMPVILMWTNLNDERE